MSSAPIHWKHVRNVLVLFSPIWVGLTCLFAAAGFGLAIFGTDKWSAKQPLVLRDETTGSLDRLGRFGSQTELKAAQETILEVARNPDVVTEALRKIGPEGGGGWFGISDDWPSLSTVSSIAKKNVNVLAPQGGEFGNTEMVYLQVLDTSPERAEQFCHAMLESLSAHLRTVRTIRADSVIEELTYSRNLTREKLDAALAKMNEVEISFGEDLAELRMLNDTLSADGTNRRTTELIDRELQTAELELERLRSLRQLLKAGLADPKKLLVSGDDLLKSQPTLLRLKEGLIDAQIITSQYASIYTMQHPRRRAAMQTEA
ncbi:MAG: hypothetical protein AAF745_10955, partial [Planctomycetota bacterium]